MTAADFPHQAEANYTPQEIANIWQLYTRMYTGFNAHLDRDLRREAKIKFDDFQVLNVLTEGREKPHEPKVVRMGEIATALNTSPSRLTYQIDRLITLGWVERVKIEKDRRGKGVVITPAGFDRFRAGFAVQKKTIKQLLEANQQILPYSVLQAGLERLVKSIETEK